MEVPLLGKALDSARASAFVGRRAERELFGAGLAAEVPAWSVLWFHGPGGVGTSTLLAQLALDAADAEVESVTVDARTLAIAGPGEVRDQILRDHGDGAVRVVFIDGAEHLGAAEAVLRTELLPNLPDEIRTVVAGRLPPGPHWRSDPAWRDRLRIVALRNLDATDADRYLSRHGIADDMRRVMVEISDGHPLALSLLADLGARGQSGDADSLASLAEVPDVVQALLARIVDDVPTATHREVLEVAAIARLTTQALVRDALDVDRHRARELFDWLQSLPYMAVEPDGVAPHDLVRDLLDADLRWRDPDAYAVVFRRVRRHIHTRLETLRGAEQRRAIADEKFVFRNLPSVLSPVDWSSWGAIDPERATPDDRDAVIGLVRAFEGDESAAIAESWWDRQPEAFHVLRDVGGDVLGFMALVTLTGLDRAELAFDPIATAALAYADREAPVRSGEVVTQTRFVIDSERYQAPSSTLNAVPILTLQRYLQTPQLAWDFLVLFEPDAMNDYFAIADLPRASNADVTIGGRVYGQFAHDFRRVPVTNWLEGVTDRALAQDPSPPARAPAELVVLSHDVFTDAVRRALRDLHRPDRLAANPLARSRVVRDRSEGDANPASALAATVREAVDLLTVDPRDEKRYRAVERTYLHPAPSQERAAERLGLPFSTYRRHLTEAVDAVVDHLWQRELHGPAGPSSDD